MRSRGDLWSAWVGVRSRPPGQGQRGREQAQPHADRARGAARARLLPTQLPRAVRNRVGGPGGLLASASAACRHAATDSDFLPSAESKRCKAKLRLESRPSATCGHGATVHREGHRSCMIPSGGETRKPCGRREEVPELVRSKIGKDPALRSERERGGGILRHGSNRHAARKGRRLAQQAFTS